MQGAGLGFQDQDELGNTQRQIEALGLRGQPQLSVAAPGPGLGSPEKAKGQNITPTEERFQLDIKYIKALARIGRKNY
jgi:hypothetical protein